MALNNDKVSSNIEFEGSSTKEFEGSGSEEFKGSDSEKFEESSIKEYKESHGLVDEIGVMVMGILFPGLSVWVGDGFFKVFSIYLNHALLFFR
ncbi:hypothetical protein RhiirA5_426170 [Rhizophagus irregularis]|uniref:Uncharacterized protein n=1 Tax=Rhizophagus irregularis TaxID=588596 RepID=A0A2I1EYF9_9GLOM|nr:hypothetical protein RhiirA5_426170 [Rhizophagus irregularis]PKY27162.1 hypothetical protein RhiirB3_442762 [Rhizophagus irregularis]